MEAQATKGRTGGRRSEPAPSEPTGGGQPTATADASRPKERSSLVGLGPLRFTCTKPIYEHDHRYHIMESGSVEVGFSGFSGELIIIT